MSSHQLSVLVRLILLSVVLLAASFGQDSMAPAVTEAKAKTPRTEKRSAWMRRGREARAGSSPAALRLRAYRQKMTMRAQRPARTAVAATSGTPGWVSLGPAPLVSDRKLYGLVSGRATSVAIDRSDTTGNTVYVGGAYGGVWKSINAAAVPESDVVWSPVTDEQPSLATGAISVRSDGSVILVGTGEPNNSLDSYYGVGIFRSTDGGTHWTFIPSADNGTHPFAGLGVAKFAWSAAGGKTDIVVAGMATTAKGYDEGAITANSNRGLYRSTDSGQTWSYQSLPDGPPISATDVVYNASAGRFIAAVRNHGLYTSSDGTNWTRLASQPTGLTAECSALANCPIYRGQLAVVSGHDEVYFWFMDIDTTGSVVDGGIWRSINSGAWTQISEAGLTNCGDPEGCGASDGFFNLELAAVPDGSGVTDVYAGAANLFKCKLPNNQTACSTVDVNLPNSWLNLTHAFGTCSSKASVHPAQHGLDFTVIGGKALMYFANDGGIYRALDGYSGLQVGSCNTPGSNQFDNLNGTLGSMMQFVSLSLDPTDQNTILGGAQGNGSPASTNAALTPEWTTVNGGDGGYSAINPATPTQWFTANTDVSIQVCTSGVDCDATTFVPVVTNATVAGDAGPSYTPFILDPQNPNEMLVGTCRVWRGSTAGTAFSTLSPNFDVLSNATCTGDEFNLVRELAAGGPKQSGMSNVVYAATEGSGPNCTGSCGGPFGGEVWVTTNAATTTMANVTGSINPLNYTISSVVLDDSDATGKTAYVGLMGFVGAGNVHIWKTTNAGQTWAPFGDTTNGLPDAPVNALLVDFSAGVVYAGTDVGVFSSPTSGAAWTEVGPGAQPGATGYLPDVAVTAIRMFSSGGTKKLRVSTYGRGIWEFALATAPDFANAIADSPQTVFPTQTATFHGTLTALNGYASAVNLSCTGTPPSTCTPGPTQVTPVAGGTAYTIAASGGVGDYSFSADAVGTDANTITHDAAITLHVVDFGLTNPNPGTVTAQQGGVSGATAFQVTASGSFTGTVSLTCQGAVITAGATCNFSPSATVSPTSATPANLLVTVSVPAGIAVNSYNVTIQATTAGAPAARARSITLSVTAPPDFTWSGGGAHTVLAGQTTPAYDFNATPPGSTFTSAVTFACSNLPDTTTACAFSPAQIFAGAGATAVSLTIATLGPNSGVGSAGQRHTLRSTPRLPLVLPVAGLVLAGIISAQGRSRKAKVVAMLGSVLLLALLVACGGIDGGGGSPSPSPPISVTVSPSSAVSLYANEAGNAWPISATQQQFTATVHNSANQNVTWGVAGGAGNGTVDANGTYTAPAVVPNPATVTVTATAQADSTKSGAGRIDILTPTALGTFPNITVSATEGVVTHWQTVSLTVQ